MTVIENLQFEFQPETKLVIEGDKDSPWLKIGGVALVEGVSKNNNKYTIANLKENHGRNFKWLVGHPAEAEKHIVGLGQLDRNEEGILRHEGRIRNTSKHPDIVEQVKDGFLEPSIHASAKNVSYDKKEGVYKMEGLSIDGVGLVAFRGVKKATIDYAIAESFDKKMSDLVETQKENNNEVVTMTKEEEAPAEPVAPAEEPKEEPAKEPEAPAEEPKEEPANEELNSKIAALEAEVKTLKEAKTEETAVVEEDDSGEDTLEIIETKKGITMSESAYKKFNNEIRSRV